MKQNKIEAVDKSMYYNAFNEWLNSFNEFIDLKNEKYMDEKWLSFANELGITLGGDQEKDQILITVEDSVSWKEAKKYYSIISYRVSEEAMA